MSQIETSTHLIFDHQIDEKICWIVIHWHPVVGNHPICVNGYVKQHTNLLIHPSKQRRMLTFCPFHLQSKISLLMPVQNKPLFLQIDNTQYQPYKNHYYDEKIQNECIKKYKLISICLCKSTINQLSCMKCLFFIYFLFQIYSYI